MNRALACIVALALVAVAGCAAPQDSEDEAAASSDSALESMADEPAESPTGAKPKVETVDLSKIDFDLATLKGSPLKIDVLDTGRDDHDYRMRDSDLNLKWVESDRHQLPAFVDKLAHGVDVGGGKCRVQSLSLKKVVVGCKWTW